MAKNCFIHFAVDRSLFKIKAPDKKEKSGTPSLLTVKHIMLIKR